LFQAELRQQLIREGKEPIYQNLPIHERMLISNDDNENDEVINENDDEDLNTTNYEKDFPDDDAEEPR
jgi:hypothetical protein